MYFEIEEWPLEHLLKQSDRLQLQPSYQRTEVWTREKRALFVDTILRGYDVPKLYFAKRKNAAIHDYDVVDGQQRIAALLSFAQPGVTDKPLQLMPGWGLEIVKKIPLSYETLSVLQLEQFHAYKFTISVLHNSDTDQQRRLFLRLQMGTALNQAELRNALASAVGDHINAIVRNHAFFRSALITDARYKREDYLAHAALGARNHDNGLLYDLDAERLRYFYVDPSEPSKQFWQKVHQVLSILEPLSSTTGRLFSKKWMFVDVFLDAWNNLNIYKSLDMQSASRGLLKLDIDRTTVAKTFADNTRYTKLLPYMFAFTKDGGLSGNLRIRSEFFELNRETIYGA